MPKISKAQGPTTGGPDPSRAEAAPPVAAPDETPAAEASSTGEIAPAPETSETSEGIAEDDAVAVSDGATGPDNAPADGKPATAPKTPVQRRTARG